MAFIIDRGMSVLKNSEDYSLKIPLRTELNRIEGTWHTTSLSADISALMLIPRPRHIEFTINMRIQLGKNGHVSLLVLITSRMCGNFCWLRYLPLGTANCKKLVSWQTQQQPHWCQQSEVIQIRIIGFNHTNIINSTLKKLVMYVCLCWT